MRRSLSIVLFLSAVLALASPAARADCFLLSQFRTCKTPADLNYQDWTYAFATPAERDSAQACFTCSLPGTQCEGFTPGPTQVVQVDVPTGVVYASIVRYGTGGLYPLGAISRDQYWISGPASATPMACTASFAVGGYGACHSAGTLSMTVQSHTVSATYDNGIDMGPCNTPPPISGALTWPVSAAVGEPFVVELSAQITNPPAYFGRAYVFGHLSFRDLPPGYSVVSCKGFGGAPTPVTEHTWGGLKVLYR